MNNKELLYEISLKYNTLKMYENTLEQMHKNNGVNNSASIELIENEKKSVEAEINKLLSSNDKGNEFVNAVSKKDTCNNLYSSKSFSSFYDNILKNTDDGLQKLYDYDVRKPKFGEVMEKISNSQWIKNSDFIVRFPKDIIDIDEWKVSHVDIQYSPFYKTGIKHISGNLQVFINDCVDVKANGKRNILLKNVFDLFLSDKKDFKISIDVVDNKGDILYTIDFNDCKLTDIYPSYFDYSSKDLRKIGMNFYFGKINISDETAC